MSRQQQLLAQMGITTWQIRRPQVFQGASLLQLGAQVKLLIIQPHAQLPHPLFGDILRALNIRAEHCHVASPEQLPRIACQHPISLWFVGTPAVAPKFNAQCVTSQLSLPDWAQLKASAQAKRALWHDLQASPLLKAQADDH
ncbi:DNA polymerase III subunit psi [Pasteurellaceae bacterium TAE3-ERU1]|uniref:DNA polymerase III subunit psi n=1 Tax=Spirabiliibacterium mucosae TaxID=28156 RepID=UPI001AAD77A7|nr:DNA polymerase III subunit psi [Spirabiliibacterium mucosae]MBE2898287.1 DNA polymerase III subunit psi [Spirabiliibacterium mucosae]MBV7387198.1 DNA polymerase III subunit psi [Pasteurellaceae bacterium TAE3-ERU1]